MRGRLDDAPTTRLIRLDGWPPSLYRSGPDGGKVIDKDALRLWEEMRVDMMDQWRGFECRRCIVWITFYGAKTHAAIGQLGNSILTMMQRAGVIRNAEHETVHHYVLTARRAPIHKTEIRVRVLPPKESLANRNSWDRMSRRELHAVLKRHQGEQVAIARALSIKKCNITRWLNEQVTSARIEQAIRQRVRELEGEHL